MLLPEPQAPARKAWEAQPANSFVLRDVRVFDGVRFQAHRDVVVQDGVIAALSPRAPAGTDVPEYDGRGHTLLPGLIDAHTHSSGPARADALRFGVTTQIDMFTAAASLPESRAQREGLERVDEADMWSAGTLVTVAGGHGTQFGLPIPTLDSTDEANAIVAARIAEGSDFIKLVLEDGAGWGGSMPTLDEPTLGAAIDAAHGLGRQALVHVGSRAEALVALRAGADGLAHLFGDAEADQAVIALAQWHGAFVIPTLTLLESTSGRASGIDADPRLAPWLTPAQGDSLRDAFPRVPERETVIDRALASTLRLHKAGVAILAGSDAPNPGTAHGASLHRELELLVAAGLAPEAALAAATSVPATSFGLGDRGQVLQGKRADLVLVAGDPAKDITATRAIVAVWKNGYHVPRPRSDTAAEAVPAFDDSVLDTDTWETTTDRIQGGGSDAVLTFGDDGLRVEAEVRTGAPWPWAGVIRTLGAQPMDPVDLSAWKAIALRLRADTAATVQVLFFSGRSGRAIPAAVPVAVATEWQDVVIDFNDVAGIDLVRVRAVAVVAGPALGATTFELGSAMLR